MLLSIFWFYAGTFVSSNISHKNVKTMEIELETTLSNYREVQKMIKEKEYMIDELKKNIDQNVARMGKQKEEYLKQQAADKNALKKLMLNNNGGGNTDTKSSKSGSGSSSSSSSSNKKPRFGSGELFQGVAKTNKHDFLTLHDFGSPIDASTSSPNDVLVFYSRSSIPKDITEEERTNISYIVNSDGGDSSSSSSNTIQNIDASKATSNCQILHVATMPSSETNKQTCFAIVENYGNQLTQRWMRKNNNSKEKLIPVTRGQTEKSRTFRPPEAINMKKHWAMLRKYFNTVDDVLDELKPIAEKVAKDNTIIVMTCNMGQSELLMNFVCNAKAKGLDVSNVLVFPTDKETKDLAEGLGLATFYDEKVSCKVLKSGERHIIWFLLD